MLLLIALGAFIGLNLVLMYRSHCPSQDRAGHTIAIILALAAMAMYY